MKIDVNYYKGKLFVFDEDDMEFIKTKSIDESGNIISLKRGDTFYVKEVIGKGKLCYGYINSDLDLLAAGVVLQETPGIMSSSDLYEKFTLIDIN